MICTTCRLKNDHADANQPNGTYVCFDCRKPAPPPFTSKDYREAVFDKVESYRQQGLINYASRQMRVADGEMIFVNSRGAQFKVLVTCLSKELKDLGPGCVYCDVLEAIGESL